MVFALYWIIGADRPRGQNLLIVIASYVFYGWWDWRFLTLILFSTLVDFSIGIRLSKTEKPNARKILLWISILVNLGLLGFFKYYNFFIENFTTAFSLMGREISYQSLNIILPVGISFYTFQTLSYSLDIYRGRLQPTRDILAFSAFVSFFPQLVAGPIERASNLLPQFLASRRFNYIKAVDGLRQILWGFFKKIVIADNCAEYANMVFSNPEAHSGSTLLIGAIAFALQIYGDFSGYSDIAIGTARLFGFNLMQNFAFPYFSRDIAEFWRRWHISLSTWFRDYLYIPLGGSRGGTRMRVRNTFIIFVVSGIWHGANWTFVIWGILNAIYFLPLLLSGKNRMNLDTVAASGILPNWKEIIQMLTTFLITVLAWVFFRSSSVTEAFTYLTALFDLSLFSLPDLTLVRHIWIKSGLVVLFIFLEWCGRKEQYALEKLGLDWPGWLRYIFYYLLIVIIFWYGGKPQEFIYFQF